MDRRLTASWQVSNRSVTYELNRCHEPAPIHSGANSVMPSTGRDAELGEPLTEVLLRGHQRGPRPHPFERRRHRASRGPVEQLHRVDERQRGALPDLRRAADVAGGDEI